VDLFVEDMVAVFGETTGYFALKEMYQNMIRDPEGRQILEDNPRINSKTVDIEWLATLPEGTFGREYYNFLRINVLF
jgi:ubiquinone biosynthesis protein COQ4